MEGKDSSNARATEDALLKPEQVAEMLNVKPSTLSMWCVRGIGPVYLKFAGSKGAVRYRKDDIEQFIAQSRQVPSVLANVDDALAHLRGRRPKN